MMHSKAFACGALVAANFALPGCTGAPTAGAEPDGGAASEDEGLGDVLPQIFPSPAHGGFDGSGLFKIPLAATLAGAAWEVDPALATVEGRPPPEGIPSAELLPSWALVTPRVAGAIEVVARAGAVEVSTTIEVVEYSAEELALGARRYNQPDDPGGPGRASCASCHLAAGGHDHSPIYTSYFGDAEILSAVTTGQYSPDEVLAVDHEWNLTADEERGIVAYLRSLPPSGL